MRILVLGAGGFIGMHAMQALQKQKLHPVAAIRNPSKQHLYTDHVVADITNVRQLRAAMTGIDAVVNCTLGNAHVIKEGMRVLLASAAAMQSPPLIIHLSTMSVYGSARGVIGETQPLNPDLGWYSQAKCQAEQQLNRYAASGGRSVTLRPGIVYGAGSQPWVGRIGRWLHAGRIGDIGHLGDGCCNLVHVRDVGAAIAAAATRPEVNGQVFNLASPAPLTWNRYFSRLAVAAGLTPLHRLCENAVRRKAHLYAPPLKILEKLLDCVGIDHAWLPEPLPLSLLKLFQQDIWLDSTAATARLGLSWTPVEDGIQESAAWFRQISR